MGITEILSLVTVLIASFISGKTLLSKSDLEQVFLTHEQKIKLYYIKLLGLSSLIGFLGGDLYILWNLTLNKKTAETANWNFAIALSFVIFICCLFTLGTVEKVIQNFIIQSHYKYKISLEIGDVYILRMMNEQLCICSKDPNADFLRNDTESILVKVEDLIEKPLIREKHQIPSRSFWQRILD
ncbi:hypothetical protein [Neobacillus soli]|uniref:hypothetical protein n=1 Tax=Neobacillus soli TaxID=220688 RepID=UPI000825D4C0|nr:hypothetical protein [Neobacillus soli]